MSDKKEEIRAEVLIDSANKKYWVNVWYGKTHAYSMGLFNDSGEAMMTKPEAETIDRLINIQKWIDKNKDALGQDAFYSGTEENKLYHKGCRETLESLQRYIQEG